MIQHRVQHCENFAGYEVVLGVFGLDRGDGLEGRLLIRYLVEYSDLTKLELSATLGVRDLFEALYTWHGNGD